MTNAAAALTTNKRPDRGGAVTERERAGESLLKSCFGFVLIVIAVADAGRYADPDLWWHILSGEHALRTGHFLMTETFSYSAAGHPWIDHERIAEVLLAWCYTAGGIVGLKLFKLLCSAATIILISGAQAETGASIPIQMAVLMGVAIGLGPEIQFRPQLFSFIGLSALLWVLARFNREPRTRLWPLIVLFGGWANLHGGYIAGLGALGLFGLISALREIRVDRRRAINTAARFGVVGLCSCAATLLTPFGLNNWRAILRTLDNPATHQAIQEWRPLVPVMLERIRETPSAAALYGIALTLMAATVAGALLHARARDLPLMAVAIVFIGAAFYAIRNLELALIALAAPLSYHLQLAVERFAGAGVAPRRESSPRPSGLKQVMFAGFAAVLLVATGLFSARLPAAIPYPSGAVAFMNGRKLTGNVLCDFNWGGYFIYHMPPQSKVFIDNRYDLAYPDSVINDYLKFWSGADTLRVLDAYPHQFVLIPPDSAPFRLIRGRRDWLLLYEDSVAALFARRASGDSEKPVMGQAPPTYFP